MVLGVGVGVAAFAVYAGYYKQQVDALADDLESGKITVDEWEAGMEREIEKLHSTAYIIGLGGLANATAQSFATIAVLVADQVEFLHKWADELRKEAKHSLAKIKARAALYLNSANATLLIALTDALGMPRLPAYPGDSSSACKSNDKCTWRFQKVDGGWDCFWTLHPAEHCRQCLGRSTAWNPLQIRAGKIITPVSFSDPDLFFQG